MKTLRSDLPPDLVVKGRRLTIPLQHIKDRFPIFWNTVLENTNDTLTDRQRYDMYCYNQDTYQTCLNDNCNNYIVRINALFCSRKCMHDSGIIQKKVQATCLDRYGSISSLGNKEIQEKSKATCIKKYGTHNAGWSENSQNKIKQTCQEKYNTDSPGASNVIRDKINKTLQSRYNGNSPFCDKSVQEKSKETNKSRYGVEYTFCHEQFRNKEKMIDSVLQKNATKYDYSIFNKEALDELMQEGIEKVQEKCGLSISCIYKYFRKIEYVYNKKNRSSYEQSIVNYLKTIVDTDIVTNSRKIISPYELDIYLPEYNLAIEFNGTYWHSVDKDIIDYRHINKTNMCEEKGIHLLHIFEHEWIKDNGISWKTFILSILNNDIIDIDECTIEPFDIDTYNKCITSFDYSNSYTIVYNNEHIGIIDYNTSMVHSNKMIQYEGMHDRRFYKLNGITIKPDFVYTKNNQVCIHESDTILYNAGYFIGKTI